MKDVIEVQKIWQRFEGIKFVIWVQKEWQKYK